MFYDSSAIIITDKHTGYLFVVNSLLLFTILYK